jgi:hypothetical protein
MHFINQPIIVDYVAWSAKNEKSIMKPKYVASNFNDYLKLYKDKVIGFSLDTYNTSTINEAVDLLQDETIEFNIAPTNMQYSFKSILDNDKLVKEQLLVLTQFVQMQDIANDFLGLQMTMNFDTRLTKDGFEAYQKQKSFREIKKANIFENLDYLKEKTVIAPLNSMDLMVKVNKTLLPLANDEALYAFLSNKLKTSFQKKGQAFKTKFIRTFKNDFISFLFQNFIGKTEQSLELFNEKFASVLKTENQDFTSKPNAFGLHLIKNLFKDFAKLRNEQPEIFKENSILERMFVSSEEDFRNIGLSYFNKDSDLQDSFIEQFKELLLHPNLDIRNFMLKFAYMSFYQSGLNKSFISSSDIIPVDIISPMLENVRNQYMKDVNSTQKKLNLLDAYFNLFMENNNAFRSYDRDNPDNKKAKTNKSKVASNRVKLYSMPITQLDNITKETNIPSTEVENGIYSQLGNKTQSENVVIDEVNGRKPAVESNINFKIKLSNTLQQFLEPFFNSQDEDIVEPFAKKLTKEDKEILAKAIGRNYKDISTFNWYDAIWSNIGQEEVYYYLKTGNNLEKALNDNLLKSKIYKQYQEFINENKSFVEGFKNLPKEIQQEQQKDFNKLKEKNSWFKQQVDEFEYNERKNLLKNEGYIENNIQLSQSSKPIVAYRTRGNDFLKALEKDNAIGNPWSHLGGSQEIKGINIRSDKTTPNSLGNRLTNPNWYAKELYDVETEYKANASKIKAPKLNAEEALKYDMNLMYQLQLKKFRKNPELIDEINAQGGLEFIKQSSHIVGVKNSRWEGKGLESNFIKVLAKSYETVSKELGKFVESNNKNQYGLYKTDTVKEAVEEFISWMIGEKHTDKLQDYRQAIIDRIPKLKGKTILYYKDLGEPSHATALDYLINKYDWNNQSQNNSDTQENDFTPKDLGLNTDSNQNDAVCK